MSLIEVKSLKYRYPHTEKLTLDGLGFEIGKGQFIGILGENKVGKSTPCQALVGFMPTMFGGAYGGHVLIDGMEAARTPVSKLCGKVGLVSQNPFNQLPGARGTMFEEVAFGLQNMEVTREGVLNRVERSLERLEIGVYRDRNPFDLSEGQIQRVAITNILTVEPEILMLDEPTSQLDPQESEDVFRAADRLAESGITIVMMEHKMEKPASYCHRLLLLHNGEQVAYDTPGRIFVRDDLRKLGMGPLVYTRVNRAFSVNCPERNPETGQECYPVTLEQTLVLKEYFPAQLQGIKKAGQESEAGPSVLSIEDVGFSYVEGSPILEGPDLELDGRPTAIVGQNGARKTALVKLLKGLLEPDRGGILLQGEDIGKRTVAQLTGRIGYVFQNPDDQIFKSRVLNEVMVGPLNLGMDEKRAKEMAIKVLDTTGILTVQNENSYDLDLSGGKMVVITSVLTTDPQVLILDEPTIAQDAGRKGWIGAMVHQLNRGGRTVLAILHDMDFAAEYLEQILIMTHGHVLTRGTGRTVSYKMDIPFEVRLEQPHITGLCKLLGYEGTFLIVEDMIGRR